jgi:hypothetical protein
MNREVLQEPVVATTGEAVCAPSCGSSGIGISAVSRCRKCNYIKNKKLRRLWEKNFETGPFNRSGTSPQPT